MQVLWLEQAETDLRELSDYLLERSPSTALRTYKAIRESVARLRDHPGMGRPGRVAGTRELVIARTPYIVAYTVDQDIGSVIVLRVLHGARRWPDEFSAS